MRLPTPTWARGKLTVLRFVKGYASGVNIPAPPPPSEQGQRKSGHAATIALVAVGILLLLTALAWTNPKVNVPLISPFICSLKDGTWFDGPDALFGVTQAGCYEVG